MGCNDLDENGRDSGRMKKTFKRESEFQSALKDQLEVPCGAVVLNVHGHAMQQAGWPDLHVVHPFWIGWLELKMDSGWLSKKQQAVCDQLWETRATSVYVVRFRREGHVMTLLRPDRTAVVSFVGVDARSLMSALGRALA